MRRTEVIKASKNQKKSKPEKIMQRNYQGNSGKSSEEVIDQGSEPMNFDELRHWIMGDSHEGSLRRVKNAMRVLRHP